MGNFGYFPTTWRQWPGAQPLEQTNPRAVGLELLPTPAGQEIVPMPPLVPSPEGENAPPQAEKVVPPERPLAPEPPPTTPKPSAKPSAESGLPGLPAEPAQTPRPITPRPATPKEMPKAQEPDKILLPKVWRNPAGQTTKAAEPRDERPATARDVPSQVVAVQSQHNEPPALENRVNAIAEAPEPPASRVEATAYVATDSPIQSPAIDNASRRPWR